MALDTHCAFTEVGVLTPGGRMRERGRCATTIPALAEEIDRVPRPRAVVLEGCPEPRRKGPPADWIARGLREHAADVAVCDPRRNHLIAKDSDKDDPIDVEKLARLYRGGYIKGVHHAESFDRVVFKRHVGLYHDSVQQRVRQANRIMGELRSSGVFVGERSFAESDGRRALGDRLPDHPPVRAELRDYFEIDARYTALAALQELAPKRQVRTIQARRRGEVPGHQSRKTRPRRRAEAGDVAGRIETIIMGDRTIPACSARFVKRCSS